MKNKTPYKFLPPAEFNLSTWSVALSNAIADNPNISYNELRVWVEACYKAGAYDAYASRDQRIQVSMMKDELGKMLKKRMKEKHKILRAEIKKECKILDRLLTAKGL